MENNLRKHAIVIGITGGLAVIMGAFGAHALEDKLASSSMSAYETGVSYHFYHLLAMIGILALQFQQENKWLQRAFWTFFLGVILFSGSLYGLALSKESFPGLSTIFGPLTPIGGLFFIAAWIFSGLGIYQMNSSRTKN